MYKFFFLLLLTFSCYKKDSTNSVSHSDNKSFEKRSYKKNEPYVPFGNIKHSNEDEKRAFSHYDNISKSRLDYIEENDEYLMWLASERRKRLASGKLNGFKYESIPGSNPYYIQKSQTARKENALVSQKYYLDIQRELQTARKRKENVKTVDTEDEIGDYEILNNPPSNEIEVKVNADED